MAEDNVTKILGNKATIYTNKFGMWQFRLWLATENKYLRKSLKTKEKTLAIERGEELYIEVARKQKNGIKHFGISIEEKKAVKAHKKEAVATVKKLILEFNLTKGDIRGKAWKQLEA